MCKTNIKSKRRLAFVANTGILRIVKEYLQTKDDYILIGIIDDNKTLKDSMIDGLQVLGTFEEIEEIKLKYNITDIVICLPEGYPLKRERYYKTSKKIGLKIPSIIFDDVIISKSVTIGDGVLIFSNTVINSNCKIGNNVIIWNGTILSHDNKIGNHVYISPSVTLGGHAEIMDLSVIGLGVTILPQIIVGNKVMVGAGSLVNKDVTNERIVFGVPAIERGENVSL